MLASPHAAMQHYGMALTLPISKRGGLTLPPALRRKLGLDGIDCPLVIVEERDGGLFLQAAAAVPVRNIPREKLAKWISRDESEMASFTRTGKAKSKK
jgi:bifunctional DNA-binding transcriptional regulator/antitoxin component of YhaV-PrlF toxin-antitoxin module